MGYEYYPLQIGLERLYDVDSIVYDDFTNSVDTDRFQLREVCVDTFHDLEGRIAYRFERSIQRSDTGGFEFDRSFYVVTDGVRTERVEDNLREVMLVYPPIRDQDWDANVFNSLPEAERSYERTHAAYEIKGRLFDSTLHVIVQNDTDNFIVKRFSEERYAKHEGLIERRFYHIETQFGIDSGLLWIQRVVE